MIGKVVRGNDVGGLLRYLYGPGRANEHTNPHVVAAWDDGVVADWALGRAPRLKRLAALLEQPLVALDRPPSPSVWHCPLRTAPGDRKLSDAEWADVASEVLHQTGLAPRGDAGGCRWVAVRHADDHIHLAVTLARQDGRRARTSHDYVRVGAACRALEARYGLTVTPARDGLAPKRATRAETEKAARQGRDETSRQTLRREVRRAAQSSSDLYEFIQRLEIAGIQVRLRYSESQAAQVTGYSVADPGNKTAAGHTVWFGGGKLAPQLSLPRLQAQWNGASQFFVPAHPAVTPRRSTGRTSHAGTTLLRIATSMAQRLEAGDPAGALATAIRAATGASIPHR